MEPLFAPKFGVLSLMHHAHAAVPKLLDDEGLITRWLVINRDYTHRRVNER
jgi:hypothetical protein